MKQIFISILALTAVACGTNSTQQETGNKDTTQQSNTATVDPNQKTEEKKKLHWYLLK